MELVPVNLHDQSALRPQEVHQETTHPHVHLGCGNAMAATETQEHSLQGAPRGCLINHFGYCEAAYPGAVDRCLPLLAR